MSEKEIEDHELEQLNKEIEAELNAYDADKEFQKEKKQFLTLTFICKLIIVLLMLMGLVKLFI
ncbi:hypothetical protein QI060_09715 [Staphylococcus saprophyticus]|uniref:Uncharacterized protein n=2 Tax=Staphylococcus saprophyticus TaxID=29385 RepID=Q4A0Y2_STAS1|nr:MULTISPECIES: hypothetical protein [Staphylococcus]ASF19264.1 hypothetical protein CEQ33_08735 [Staphylococcus saprophyticus]EHY93723.1 hypothetical protein SSME_01020 [Staphylococcus saprophyticus subsp. saprophyticus KACC 16562]MBF2752238.1 hypothetical protein [Staphylococcus saprophyticus]MBF2779644.1 hypothetical protein [Staphylococcus saprophyticus]MBF2782353.1 hypothetical protein [Staphylococcus saprophyticus]